MTTELHTGVSTPERRVLGNAATAEERRGGRTVALVVMLLGFLIYNANLRLVSSGDCYPARYLPFSILKHGTLTLDPVAANVTQGHMNPYWLFEMGGHKYSLYPITVPVLITPLYIPAVLYLNWQGWTEERLDNTARLMEKLTASLIASLSAGLLYLLLLRRTNCRWPLLLALAYAFGSNNWMISSQALWQHGMAQLLIILCLFLILGSTTAPRALVVGICLALMVAVRIPDAILAAPLGLYSLRWARGRSLWLLLGVAIPLAPLLTYNLAVMHRLTGAFGYLVDDNFFRHSLPLGIAGLLFSPGRGLFVFTPFLLFLPIGLYYTLREPRLRALGWLTLGAVLVQLTLYARAEWTGGWSWGPRYLTDMLPLLVWMLAAGLGALHRAGLAAFLLTVGLSIGVQAIGAFWYTGTSDAVISAQPGQPNTWGVWDPRNTPFVAELQHGLAPRELFFKTEGSVDRFRVDGSDVENISPGDNVEIEGWTLSDRRTPTAVYVYLFPAGPTTSHGSRSYPVAATDLFFERLDVTHGMRGRGPSGWRVVMKSADLDPGPYVVAVRAQGNYGGEIRHVVHRRLDLLTPAPSKSRLAATR